MARIATGHRRSGPLLIEPKRNRTELAGAELDTAFVNPDRSGYFPVLISNAGGYTRHIQRGTELGTAVGVTIVDTSQLEGSSPDSRVLTEEDATTDSLSHPNDENSESTRVNKVSGDRSMSQKTYTGDQGEVMEPQPEEDGNSEVETRSQQRKQRLTELLGKASNLPSNEEDQVQSFLMRNHEAFVLEDGERGETDLTHFQIPTGDAQPRKQPLRRMLFAVRRDVARQLEDMQRFGVIQPSSSPWASPIVLVRKKDGTLRICVDYRSLNSVTKADTFPLPRIDDLLDQLSQARYFSSIDLASGYWEIKVHPNSQEKTAFTTPQGLFEFRVMPFGLRNAPAAFQRLMQQVLTGLNPPDGPDFVAAYLDDILIFSRSMDEHLMHLNLVISRLMDAGLKLNATKCHFVREEVEYLGHLLTPSGLRPSQAHTAAVKEFAVPQDVTGVRRFLGLASYYRRFIPGFAKTAYPLHALT